MFDETRPGSRAGTVRGILDARLDYTDALTVAIAERIGESVIATFDPSPLRDRAAQPHARARADPLTRLIHGDSGVNVGGVRSAGVPRTFS
jgi:hypothetical protein